MLGRLVQVLEVSAWTVGYNPIGAGVGAWTGGLVTTAGVGAWTGGLVTTAVGAWTGESRLGWANTITSPREGSTLPASVSMSIATATLP